MAIVRQPNMEYLHVRVHPENRGRVGVWDRNPAHPHDERADPDMVEVFVSGDDVVEVARTLNVDLALREKRLAEVNDANPSGVRWPSNEAERPAPDGGVPGEAREPGEPVRPMEVAPRDTARDTRPAATQTDPGAEPKDTDPKKR